MEAQVRHYRADEVEIARLCGYEQWARTFARWQELTDPAAVDGWTAGQLVGSPETVRRRLAAFVEAGFDHVIVHTSTPCVPRAVRHRWAAVRSRGRTAVQRCVRARLTAPPGARVRAAPRSSRPPPR
jgi:alkanesulfonate monooxygenase SsuD/methylene tetrahydromethanopterin reductase-like flavin-dependent oxidoreductase (luciferase family)